MAMARGRVVWNDGFWIKAAGGGASVCVVGIGRCTVLHLHPFIYYDESPTPPAPGGATRATTKSTAHSHATVTHDTSSRASGLPPCVLNSEHLAGILDTRYPRLLQSIQCAHSWLSTTTRRGTKSMAIATGERPTTPPVHSTLNSPGANPDRTPDRTPHAHKH